MSAFDRDSLADLALVDHHCHGVTRQELDLDGIDALLSEGGSPAPGLTNFDTALGLSVRRHCSPVLDLGPNAAAADYAARRAELGADEVNRRLLRASHTDMFLVDTGFRGGELLSPAELADAAGGTAREIVRLEAVAESLAAAGAEPGEFPDRYAEALRATVSATSAVGVKSVAAYRGGLHFDPAAPARQEVKAAAELWLERGPGADGWRLDDPVLTRALLWCAVELALPIQFHTGFGDPDLRLRRANPVLLSDFIAAVPARVPIMLLHCYPYHREAAYLAAVHPHVHLDLGLTLNFVGPSRAGALLAEVLELAPFGKLLYSSDAFGLAELYCVSALVFRRSLVGLLDERVASGEWSAADAARLAAMIGSGNAARVYGLS